MSVTLVVTSTALARGTGVASQPLTFDQPRVVIGRGAHADVRLPSRAVSDTHAVLRVEAADLSITDEGSTNGTAINGQPLVRGRRKAVRAGDRIVVPGYEITVESSLATPDPPERTATVARRLLADALAAVGGEAAPPELVLASGRRAGQRWKLPPAPARLVAGRGDVCEVVLDDVDCSRQHAEFVRDGEGVLVRDLGSKNGIFVGERRVSERRLRDGDEVALGRSLLRYSDPAEELLRSFDAGADEAAVLLPPPPPPPPAPPETPAPSAAAEPAATDATETPATATPGGAAPGPDAPGAPAASASKVPAAPRPTRPIERKRPGRAIDGVVIALAVIILAVSITALYFLLRGTPLPPR